LATQGRRPRGERTARQLPVHFENALLGAFSGETIDLSPHGLAIRTSRVLPPQTRLALRLTLPTGQTQHLRGLVRWCAPGQPGAMGVQLESTDAAFLRFLNTSGVKRIAPGILLPHHGAADCAILPSASMPRKKVEGHRRPRLARFPVAFALRFGTNAVLDGKGVTFNLSTQGVGITGSGVPAPETELRLSIERPGGRSARVEGTVMWVRRALHGIGVADSAGVHVDFADDAFYRLVIDLVRAEGNVWEPDAVTMRLNSKRAASR
jgi:hypothetical protein